MTTRKIYRSAKDGRFKTKGFAKHHPSTTIRETVKIKKR